jgi:hypothetical protein
MEWARLEPEYKLNLSAKEYAGSNPAPQILWGWANGKAALAHQVDF